jgi:hypothetical protein
MNSLGVHFFTSLKFLLNEDKLLKPDIEATCVIERLPLMSIFSAFDIRTLFT